MNCHRGKLCLTKVSMKVGVFEKPVTRVTLPPLFRYAVQKPKVPWLKRCLSECRRATLGVLVWLAIDKRHCEPSYMMIVLEYSFWRQSYETFLSA